MQTNASGAEFVRPYVLRSLQNALLLLGLENSQSTILLIDEKTGDFVRLTRVPPRKDGNGPRPSGGLTSLVVETERSPLFVILS